MKLSFEIPTKHIKEFNRYQDFIFALPHLIDYDLENEYEKAIKDAKKTIWLDNGAFEKKNPEGIDSLLAKARRIGAKVVFSPDYWNDSQRTFNALENFNYIKEQCHSKIMTGVVIQAETLDEFLEFYEECINNDEIGVIGINHLTTSRVWQFKNRRPTKQNQLTHDLKRMPEDRISMLQYLQDNFKEKNRNVHLLGLGGSYKDIIYASKNFSWVVSNDTSAPFWAAMFGDSLDDRGNFSNGKRKEVVDFNYIANPTQLNLATYNINKIKELCAK